MIAKYKDYLRGVFRAALSMAIIFPIFTNLTLPQICLSITFGVMTSLLIMGIHNGLE